MTTPSAFSCALTAHERGVLGLLVDGRDRVSKTAVFGTSLERRPPILDTRKVGVSEFVSFSAYRNHAGHTSFARTGSSPFLGRKTKLTMAHRDTAYATYQPD